MFQHYFSKMFGRKEDLYYFCTINKRKGTLVHEDIF